MTMETTTSRTGYLAGLGSGAGDFHFYFYIFSFVLGDIFGRTARRFPALDIFTIGDGCEGDGTVGLS
jgi:hypothetical protein